MGKVLTELRRFCERGEGRRKEQQEQEREHTQENECESECRETKWEL